MSLRELYTARLAQKVLLSASAACYHFEFIFEGHGPRLPEPGQFLSLVADDAAGKTYTRAYSLASACQDPGPARTFELCVNRVPGGVFSNLLCDMREGDTINCHGPHGLFTPRDRHANGLMVAAGTGIAPLRGFVQRLVADAEPGLTDGAEYWLVYEAPQPEEHFYHDEFASLATRHPSFHYLPVLGGEGQHAEMEDAIVRVSAALPGHGESAEAGRGSQDFTRYAYVCGLGEMVKVARARLLATGWQKQQVLFERYD
jgi:ferredoxin-NADP reductase